MSTTYYNPDNGAKLNIKEMPLPQFAKDWLSFLLVEMNLAPRTVFDYSISATTFLRWLKNLQLGLPIAEFRKIDASDVALEDVASLTRNDIYEYLSFCANDLDNTAYSRASKLAALRSMYGYLHVNAPGARIKEDPTQDISSPKKEKKLPKYLNIDEAKKLLAAVDGKDKDRDYCIILWLLSCGMRVSELVGVNLQDIKGNSLRVYGKGRKERIVHLNAQCLDALEKYMVSRVGYKVPDTEKALFVTSQAKKRITVRRVQQIVEKYLAKAGLQGMGYSPHKLRHSTASILYSNNVGLIEIKDLLGHASLRSTEIYTHLINKEATEKALDSLGNSLAGDYMSNSEGLPSPDPGLKSEA